MKKIYIVLCLLVVSIMLSPASRNHALADQLVVENPSNGESLYDLNLDFDNKGNTDIKYTKSNNYTYYVLSEEKKEIAISKITGITKEVVIPSEIDGYKVVGLGLLDNNFSAYDEGSYNNPEQYQIFSKEDAGFISNLTIPEGIRQIGFNAFKGLTVLRKVTFPDSLLEIGADAFAGVSLNEVSIPRNVLSIRMHAFYNCKSLKKVTVKSSNVIFEGEYPPFAGCDFLNEVVWNNVEQIRMDGFRLNQIKKAVIPPSVKSIMMLQCNIKKLMIKGKDTVITWDSGYNYDWNKDLIVILPKNSKAIPTLKKLKAKYIEVSLPTALNLKVSKLYSSSAPKCKITWRKQDSRVRYQIFYAKTKKGIYKLIKNTNDISYISSELTGYIKVRPYKIYQGEIWYGTFEIVNV